MIINYILMYINFPNDLLHTSSRVKSMSAQKKKNSIKFYSLYLSSESIVCSCFLSGHLSVVPAQDYKQRGRGLLKVRRNARPNPTQSRFPVSCSFVMGDLVGGGADGRHYPLGLPSKRGPAGPHRHADRHVRVPAEPAGPTGASPPRASQAASARGADWR